MPTTQGAPPAPKAPKAPAKQASGNSDFESKHPRSRGKFAKKGSQTSGQATAKPDGLALTPETRATIAKYQKAHGLPVTGQLDSATKAYVAGKQAQNTPEGKAASSAAKKAQSASARTAKHAAVLQRAAARKRATAARKRLALAQKQARARAKLMKKKPKIVKLKMVKKKSTKGTVVKPTLVKPPAGKDITKLDAAGNPRTH